MMASVDTMKRFVAVATRVCRENGYKVDNAVLAFVCLATEGKVDWRTSVGSGKEDSVQEDARSVVSAMISADSPCLRTITMQVGMVQAVQEQQRLYLQQQQELTSSCEQLKQEILAAKGSQTQAGRVRELYEKIVDLVSLKGGMDAALDNMEARQDVSAAVDSVFPPSLLTRFLTLPVEQRAQQLEELATLCRGICLFNQHCGRGGLALPRRGASSGDTQKAEGLMRTIDDRVAYLEMEIIGLNAQVYKMLSRDKDSTAERLKQETANKASTVMLLKQLRGNIDTALGVIKGLEDELEEMLFELEDSIGNAKAVPKELVYPQFHSIGGMHAELVSERKLLAIQHVLFDKLQSLQGGFQFTLSPVAIKTTQPISNQLLLSTPKAAGPPIPRSLGPEGDAAAGAERTGPVPETGDETDLECSGLCPVTLVRLQGLTAFADRSLGAVRYRGKLYGAASQRAMDLFCANPAEYVADVEVVLEKHPQLLEMCRFTQERLGMTIPEVAEAMATPMKVEFGCQTPVHFVDKLIDKSYEWNVWALRRRAIKIADLRRKCTHSTQTAMSHMRRDQLVQVWKPKEAAVQTASNKGQLMPKKLLYVAGLRGPPTVKMNVVSLELEVGQPHHF